MTSTERSEPHAAGDTFDAFFDHATPLVFGYALRLCGGNRDRAADITQEAWLTLVREHGRSGELPGVGWLIRAARSRFIDQLRHEQRLPSKLALVWSGERGRESDVDTGELVDRLDSLRPEHRAVLMMFYVDDLPAAEVARELGMSRSSVYDLLGRAKAELRSVASEVRHA